MIASPKRFARWFLSFGLGSLATLFTQLPGKTADNIFFTYGPIKLTVKVESLENFVETGDVDANLGFLFNLVGTSEEELDKLRELMQFKADVDPLILSRFFRSSVGEDLLNRAGYVFNAPWGGNGLYGIRAALIQAVMDKEDGLTLLNFIKKYPTDIHLEGETVEERAKAVDLVVRATEHYIQALADLSAEEAKTDPPISPSLLAQNNPTKPGPYGVMPKDTWQLLDPSRDRRFYVDVYRPQRWKSGQTPVVVISHGLASRPDDFDQIAKKLASYGFFVALPQHPGSDFALAQAFLEGEARQPYLVEDFIDRPKDITFLLDELERRNQSEFQGRLNLTEVGMGGHSFGGYTALAIAGAEIDWDYLTTECDIGYGVPNTALLLQCDALTLPQENYQFRDPRVTAIVAANPVNSAVFGIKGLNKVTIPVVMMGGSYDPATPFVLEQARSFPRLGSQEKYLTLMEGQAHVDFSKLDASVTNIIQSVDKVTLPDPNLLHQYGASIILPFMQVHIAKEESYRPYLESAAVYSQLLSENEEFKFYLISEKSDAALIKDIQAFRRANGITPLPNEYPAPPLASGEK
ncbi:MAG: alpha/beta hydrolase [Synechocystis sp.]